MEVGEAVIFGPLLGISMGISFVIGFLFAKKLYHEKPPQLLLCKLSG